MSTIFWLIVTATLQVTLLSAVALLIHWIGLRNRPKESARLLAFSALLMLCLSAAAILPLPSWFNSSPNSGQPSPIVSAVSTAEGSVAQASEPGIDVTIDEEAIASLPPLTLAERMQNFTRQLESETGNTSESGSSWLLACVRFSGITIGILLLCGMIRFGIGLVALRRLKSASHRIASGPITNMASALCDAIGCKRKIEIYSCDKLTTAATIGSIKPHIFLASDFEDWSPDDQRSVMAHEIAHIHHRDFEANIICQICRVVHFFNPAVQWLANQMRLQQELAADRVAAIATTGAADYSRTLASLALRQDSVPSPMASMFLPRENNFIQRIKMLQAKTPDRPSRIKLIVPALTLLLAIGICGIRPPASAMTSTIATVDDDDKGFDLSWIPSEGSVACMRPERLFKAPMLTKLLEKVKVLKSITEQQDRGFENATGLGTEHISQSIGFSGSSTDMDQSFYIYRTFEDNVDNFKSLGKIVGQDKRFPMFIEREDKTTWLNYGLILDEKTILWAYSKEAVDKAKSYGNRKPFRAPWYDNFQTVRTKPVVATLRGEDLKVMASNMVGPFLGEELIDEICKCRSLVISLDVKQNIKLDFTFEFTNASDAKAVEQMIPDLRTRLTKVFGAMSKAPSQWQAMMGEAALASVEEAEVKLSGQSLKIKASFSPNMKALSGVARELNDAAKRTQGMNNMRQLALGMLNYESAYGSLPKATMISKSGHEYSWKIAILPFIEQNELYEAYRFDEPWNSAHNTKVTSDMPDVFKHPASESETDTNFFAVVGPGTLFPPEGKVTFRDALDGSMRTVLLVEAIRDSHWAKPGGIPLEEALVPGTLGGFTEGVIHMNMLDGSVRSVSDGITSEMLGALYSIAGGEGDIELSDLALELPPTKD